MESRGTGNKKKTVRKGRKTGDRATSLVQRTLGEIGKKSITYVRLKKKDARREGVTWRVTLAGQTGEGTLTGRIN